MHIKVLGGGCANCKTLENNVRLALEGKEFTLEKVTDIKDIMAHGVMSTPGLIIDDVIKSVGKVLSVEEIKKII